MYGFYHTCLTFYFVVKLINLILIIRSVPTSFKSPLSNYFWWEIQIQLSLQLKGTSCGLPRDQRRNLFHSVSALARCSLTQETISLRIGARKPGSRQVYHSWWRHTHPCSLCDPVLPLTWILPHPQSVLRGAGLAMPLSSFQSPGHILTCRDLSHWH